MKFAAEIEILFPCLNPGPESGEGLDNRCGVIRWHDAIRFGRIRSDSIRCRHLAQLQLVAADEDVAKREVAVDGAEEKRLQLRAKRKSLAD